MKVVILAGGRGTRISEESNFRPKPMIDIGGMPIMWHIMKEYSWYGFNEFVICAGYRQQYIKDWFGDYFRRVSDVTFDYTHGKNEVTVHEAHVEPWKVTIVDTGLDTMTGGRLKRVQKYIGNETFLLTYGDAVCDVNIADTVKFHQEHGKIATLTAVLQDQSKGVLDIGEDNTVKAFREKNITDQVPINAGYMVFAWSKNPFKSLQRRESLCPINTGVFGSVWIICGKESFSRKEYVFTKHHGSNGIIDHAQHGF